MGSRRQDILKALESFSHVGSADESRVERGAQALADGVEFFLGARPTSAQAIVETYKEGRVVRHRILYKVRFKNTGWTKGSGRRTATVVPSAPDAFASLVSNVSGEDIRTCSLLLRHCEEAPVSDEELSGMAALVGGVVRRRAESEYGRDERRRILESASARSEEQLRAALQDAIADSVANGAEEEGIVRMVRDLVVEDVHRR